MVKLMRLPSLMYSCTARSRSLYEYMNYLQAVQEIVRIPLGQFAASVNIQDYSCLPAS